VLRMLRLWSGYTQTCSPSAHVKVQLLMSGDKNGKGEKKVVLDFRGKDRRSILYSYQLPRYCLAHLSHYHNDESSPAKLHFV